MMRRPELVVDGVPHALTGVNEWACRTVLLIAHSFCFRVFIRSIEYVGR